jgi:hypothetical protein
MSALARAEFPRRRVQINERERDYFGLRRANEILKTASPVLARELDPQSSKWSPLSTNMATAPGSSRSAGCSQHGS